MEKMTEDELIEWGENRDILVTQKYEEKQEKSTFEAYVLEIEEGGKKWYYEHDTCFPTDKPSHRCLMELKPAKAKRTKLLKKNHKDNIKIKKATITIGEEVEL